METRQKLGRPDSVLLLTLAGCLPLFSRKRLWLSSELWRVKQRLTWTRFLGEWSFCGGGGG